MKHNTLLIIILLMLSPTLFTGCSSLPSKPQAVVIDVRSISETTGINEQINKRIETMKQQIFEEVTALSVKLRKEIEDEKTGIGATPSEEDQKKIQTLQKQLNKQIIQARNEGNARFKKEAAEIRQDFVDDIMSVAQQVAIEHGASIILGANAGVVWSDGSVDITDQVIKRMSGDEKTLPAVREQN